MQREYERRKCPCRGKTEQEVVQIATQIMKDNVKIAEAEYNLLIAQTAGGPRQYIADGKGHHVWMPRGEWTLDFDANSGHRYVKGVLDGRQLPSVWLQTLIAQAWGRLTSGIDF